MTDVLICWRVAALPPEVPATRAVCSNCRAPVWLSLPNPENLPLICMQCISIQEREERRWREVVLSQDQSREINSYFEHVLTHRKYPQR